MRKFIKIILLWINILSCVVVLGLWPFSILGEILNPPTFEKLLMKLKIPWDFDTFLKVGYISVAVMIVTYIIRKKLFND